MPTAKRKPSEAAKTVWLARCPANCPGFEGMYVFAAPDPPRLERTGKKFLVWNYGFTVLPANIYHRLFKGLRLHASEGPRRVSLQIERAAKGPWVARYEWGTHYRSDHYTFGTKPNPEFTQLRNYLPTWSNHLWTMSNATFLDVFSGIRLPPGNKPVTVSITATALD